MLSSLRRAAELQLGQSKNLERIRVILRVYEQILKSAAGFGGEIAIIGCNHQTREFDLGTGVLRVEEKSLTQGNDTLLVIAKGQGCQGDLEESLGFIRLRLRRVAELQQGSGWVFLRHQLLASL
jgi:hypothetical protein